MTRRLHTCFKGLLRSVIVGYLVFCFSRLSQSATATGGIEIISGQAHPRNRQPDLSDIVVWLEPVKPFTVQPVEASKARLLQKNKTFTPHVLVVRVGTVVEFPNADPIYHSAFSNYDGQLFDLGLYPPGTTKWVRFSRPGIVRVFCNIHPTMSAVIVVLDTPYFTIAKRDGMYEIANLQPGSYVLHTFDERATNKPSEDIRVSVSSEEGRVQLPVLRISEEGYAPLPHKNKYGLDYPPEKSVDKYDGVPR